VFSLLYLLVEFFLILDWIPTNTTYEKWPTVLVALYYVCVFSLVLGAVNFFFTALRDPGIIVKPDSV
jgi:hypothetical protein